MQTTEMHLIQKIILLPWVQLKESHLTK